MTKGEKMNVRMSMTVATVMCAATLSACGGSPDPQITGTVSHAGRYANGSTHFMLQGSDKTYDCNLNESDNCTLVKEGLQVSMTYTTSISGRNSVTTIQIVDSPDVKSTVAPNPGSSAPQ